MRRNPVRDLRFVGIAEGASFLVLLGLAMPLKYLAGLPGAVRVVGSLHGFLFIAYVIAAVRAARARGWSAGRVGTVLAAALLPFGPFVLDGRLRAEEVDSSAGVA